MAGDGCMGGESAGGLDCDGCIGGEKPGDLDCDGGENAGGIDCDGCAGGENAGGIDLGGLLKVGGVGASEFFISGGTDFVGWGGRLSPENCGELVFAGCAGGAENAGGDLVEGLGGG